MTSAAQPETQPEQDKRALYAAFKSKDTRFDGRVFVGVSSTGIYCRPVCHAKMPKYENCTFFSSAAEAEAAGYRPCMLCRPELAPGMSSTDATSSLARRAALTLQSTCSSGDSLEQLAGRLGYTDRHLRRVFVDEFNVTPVQYLQTCRLLLAKNLLTDSNLSVTQIAQASGFSSVRRFNDAFKKHYRLSPSDLRKRAKTGTTSTDGITVRLNYRPPYLWNDILAFLRFRQLSGIESITDDAYRRTVRIPAPDEGTATGWLRVTHDENRHALAITMSESLLPVLPQVIARVRRQFDIDCDPQAIFEGISTLDEIVPGAAKLGTRLPGCFETFETATRAILGQQVSVVAANKLAARMVERFGVPVETGIDGLTHSFPTPAELLALEGPIEDRLGPLGIIGTRSRTIAEIARLLENGELDLSATADVPAQIERLLAIKGIGNWSAQYLAMRTMSYPDAFLESDVGVKHALPDKTPSERLELAENWRPWRSYANLCLWNSLE